MATTRSIERVAAAVGLLQEAPIKFEPVADVPLGGVLCALPALLGFGLLRHTRESFTLPPGFYPIGTIFLVGWRFWPWRAFVPWKRYATRYRGNGRREGVSHDLLTFLGFFLSLRSSPCAVASFLWSAG